MQSVLHALFLPSGIKNQSTNASPETGKPSSMSPPTTSGQQGKGFTGEFVKGGAVYAECELVRLPGNTEARLGGEDVGQLIWESLEKGLATWRKQEELPKKKDKVDNPTTGQPEK